MRLLASVLALCLLVSGCTLWKQPKNPSWKNATGSEQYERLMWKSIQEKNWKDAGAHLAPMFVGVSADGRRFDRAGWLEHWKNIEIRDLSLGELTVQSSGADMVVTYELQLQASGIPAAAKGFRVVSVWQQLQRGWVLTAQSATVIQ
jgi:hypothetical protein